MDEWEVVRTNGARLSDCVHPVALFTQATMDIFTHKLATT